MFELYFTFKLKKKAGEMAWWFRILAVPPEFNPQDPHGGYKYFLIQLQGI